jgi:hypothetical protein
MKYIKKRKEKKERRRRRRRIARWLDVTRVYQKR